MSSGLQGLWGGRRSLPHHVLWALVATIILQLSAALIFTDHYLGRITALVTIFAVCLLNLALWIAALVAYFGNSAPNPFPPS